MEATKKKSKPPALAIRSPDGVWSLPQVKRSEGLHPTDIGWCDFSANVIRAIDTQTGKIGWHCDPQSPACANCYAEAINKFVGTGLDYRREHFDSGRVKIELDMQRINAILNYRIPKGFTGKAGDCRPKVFWNDMTDGAGEFVTDDMLDTMMAVVMLRPDMDHLWLTKRIERLAAYLNTDGRFGEITAAAEAANFSGTHPRCHSHEAAQRGDWGGRDWSDGKAWPLPSLWVGATVENQRQAEIRSASLSRCPSAVRFLSVEPLLGDIDLTEAGVIFPGACGCQEEAGRTPCDQCGDTGAVASIDWAILGCESNGKRTGRFADEYHDAAESVINQCRAAGVAVFHKQWPHEGKKCEDLATLPERMRLREWPKARVAS